MNAAETGPPSSTPPPKPSGTELPGLAAFATMGLTIAVLEGLGVVLGLWVDRSFGSTPWGLLIGIALSTVAAVVSVVTQVRRFL